MNHPPVLTFFNNKSGVGKTSLLYHLSWMYASLGKRIVVADLDPQANLTAVLLEEEAIEEIWELQTPGSTIYRCVEPLTKVADLVKPELREITTDLYLIPGDVGLSGYEDMLSNEWPNSLGSSNRYRPMRILASFWQVIQDAANEVNADMILVDIGPNLGAINRSVLIATDYVIIPLGADLFSLQGLKNLGPTLSRWKDEWENRLINWNKRSNTDIYPGFELPQGKMQPIGYLCQQHGVRLERPIKAYDKWINQIPKVYREEVLDEQYIKEIKPDDDEYCLATIKHYRSLVPLAQAHRKPIFNLTAADGAIGSHANAVASAREDFNRLADKIAAKITSQQQ